MTQYIENIYGFLSQLFEISDSEFNVSRYKVNMQKCIIFPHNKSEYLNIEIYKVTIITTITKHRMYGYKSNEMCSRFMPKSAKDPNKTSYIPFH